MLSVCGDKETIAAADVPASSRSRRGKCSRRSRSERRTSALAGLFPWPTRSRASSSSAPRTCGAVPVLPINNVGVPYCSPRPRGCSVDGVVVLEVGHRPAGGGRSCHQRAGFAGGGLLPGVLRSARVRGGHASRVVMTPAFPSSPALADRLHGRGQECARSGERPASPAASTKATWTHLAAGASRSPPSPLTGSAGPAMGRRCPD